jgi:hypothetical protein
MPNRKNLKKTAKRIKSKKNGTKKKKTIRGGWFSHEKIQPQLIENKLLKLVDRKTFQYQVELLNFRVPHQDIMKIETMHYIKYPDQYKDITPDKIPPNFKSIYKKLLEEEESKTDETNRSFSQNFESNVNIQKLPHEVGNYIESFGISITPSMLFNLLEIIKDSSEDTLSYEQKQIVNTYKEFFKSKEQTLVLRRALQFMMGDTTNKEMVDEKVELLKKFNFIEKNYEL